MRKGDLFEPPYKIAEEPIKGAPYIELDDGHGCIPQHFLKYDHSYDSVTEIISDIDYADKYPIFVCDQGGGLTIQIGIIGFDNYKEKNSDNPKHIVYGRKWRVEKNLPSSEVIQTVFLALQKAREHEVRELLKLKSIKTHKKSTPFSGHHDTPYLAECLNQVRKKETSKGLSKKQKIESCLERLEFDSQKLTLINFQECFSNITLLEIEIGDSNLIESDMPELLGSHLTITLEGFSEDTLFLSIIKALIQKSNEHVEENFTYREFKRFSSNVSISDIGDISIALRNKDNITKSQHFLRSFKETNYQVDATRVPKIKNGMVMKLKDLMDIHGELSGHLPLK